MMLVYMLAPLSNDMILPVGFVLGYINLMMFSPMGSYMTELFPTAVRGVAQGFCYNAGRGIGAIFPPWSASSRNSWGWPRDRRVQRRRLRGHDRRVVHAAGNQGPPAVEPGGGGLTQPPSSR